MNENTALYQVLINLPLKCNVADGHSLNTVNLDLDFSTGLQIVCTLFFNHNLINCELVSRENKLKMIEQNNELVVRLQKLPVSVVTGSANGSALKSKYYLLSSFERV